MPASNRTDPSDVRVFLRPFSLTALAIAAGLFLAVVDSVAWSAENDAAADAKPAAEHVPFKVNAEDTPSEPVDVVQPWKTIVLDKDYRGAWIVAGDLNGDGQAEIVSCRALMEGGDHYTASVVVHRLDGSVLWKWGNPKNRRDGLGCDYACQIYDWNGDGTNEVIVAAKEKGKTWLIELDGPTGKENRRFEIPNNSADCITFCNLSGNDRPTDVLLKTRYTQIWAYNYDGEQLWTSDMPGGQRTAHQARPMDIDGDGKDEVQAGFAMLNSDGSVRWALNDSDPIFDVGRQLTRGHLDCARVLKMGDTEAESRLVLTFCGGERMAIVTGEGKILWHNPAHHFESVDVGKVTAGVPGKQIVVDIPYAPVGKKPIWILDDQGNQLGEIITHESRFHRLVDWDGNGLEDIVVGEPPAVYDGTTGRKIAAFDTTFPDGEQPPHVDPGNELFICWQGDLTGDGVPDVIYGTNPGTVLFIYKNESGKKPEGNVPLGTGVNVTLY